MTFETIISYSQQFTIPDEYYMDSLLRIINDGDAVAYSNLFETLHHSCFLDNNYNHDKFIRNRMLFYSIYHVDKNNSSQGYLRLYYLINNFYKIRGKALSENSARLSLYFLKKAAQMGNKKALECLLELEAISNYRSDILD